jgi:predicted HAD superfamily Cof-like phosphohydrolase
MSNLIFKDQKAFMGHFRQAPGPGTAALYNSLCAEEFSELQEAWQNYLDRGSVEDYTEIADACLDLIYVATGLMHALGLDPQPLWDEVHRSNIDKLKHPCPTCDGKGSLLVVDELSKPEQKPCHTCHGQQHLYEVRRREDGKVLKPEGWKPPQLQALVAAMMSEASK